MPKIKVKAVKANLDDRANGGSLMIRIGTDYFKFGNGDILLIISFGCLAMSIYINKDIRQNG